MRLGYVQWSSYGVVGFSMAGGCRAGPPGWGRVGLARVGRAGAAPPDQRRSWSTVGFGRLGPRAGPWQPSAA